MKALLYKELKLTVHPLCYVFIGLAGFVAIIPDMPISIVFVYAFCCYPLIFMGVNKGQQSNDLYFTTLLPVRKKDIVLARIITLTFIQAISIVICLLGLIIRDNFPIFPLEEEEIVSAGLNSQYVVPIIGFALIAFSCADIIFLSFYYKKGKSILLSTLLSVLALTTILTTTTLILPELFIGFYDFIANNIIGILIFLVASIGIYFGMRFATYKIGSKMLEKVDF